MSISLPVMRPGRHRYAELKVIVADGGNDAAVPGPAVAHAGNVSLQNRDARFDSSVPRSKKAPTNGAFPHHRANDGPQLQAFLNRAVG
jgi:hypothetical protein